MNKEIGRRAQAWIDEQYHGFKLSQDADSVSAFA
jgi:hypothetical protein